MRKEMARIAERAKQRLQQAIAEGLHEGRIEEDGTIVIESDLAAVQATRVTMSSTATAKPRPLLRLNQKAELVPPAQFARWHEIASATAGLSRLELAILGAIAEHCRRLHVDGFAGSLSFMRLADANDTDPKYVQAAVKRLVGLGLIGVRPGAGHRANTYLPALPRRTMAAMATAAADDAPPF